MFKNILGTALALGLLAIVPSHGTSMPKVTPRALTVSNDYTDLANTALARFAEIEGTVNTIAFDYAYAASAYATINGWSSPGAHGYLSDVRTLRLTNPDGSFKGWLSEDNQTYVYTITLADHIGPVMLEAYKGGQATATEVLDIAHALVTAQQWTTVGRCISYRVAILTQDCVHNANIATAYFLDNVRRAGLVVPGVGDMVSSIMRQELYRYNTTQKAWPYSDTQTFIQDADHGGLSAEAAKSLFTPIGDEAVYKLMTTTYTGTSEVNSPLGHLRAGQFDCERAGNWLTEAQAYQAATLNDPTRQAQIARWSAKIAKACESGVSIQ